MTDEVKIERRGGSRPNTGGARAGAGGVRAGAGHPKYPRNEKVVRLTATGKVASTGRKPTTIAREQAIEMGIMPHVWLLSIMQGNPVEQKRVEVDEDGNKTVHSDDVYPDIAFRIDCGKSAAPFYAPKLISSKMNLRTEHTVSAMTDDEIERKFKSLIELASK